MFKIRQGKQFQWFLSAVFCHFHCRIILLSVLTLFPITIGAQPKTPHSSMSHGLTLLGKLKYGENFKYLDYVNPEAPKGGSISRYAIGTFDSFNPYIIKGNPASGLGFIFQTLFEAPADEISAGYGQIAEKVKVENDLSSATFFLRKTAIFNDGTPITSDDVIWTFNTLKKHGAPFYRFYYKNISRAIKLGSHKVKFEFSGNLNRELPHITGQLPVLSKRFWKNRDFNSTSLEPPLGSGPYRIFDFEPGRYIEFKRVQNWWAEHLPINKGRHNFDIIRFEYYRDQTVALEAFKAGQYDLRIENASMTWATGYKFAARKQGRVILKELKHSRPTGMQAFIFNLRKNKFSDPVLRKAMSFAFDFEWSNKNLFYNQYFRTKSFFSNSELAATKLPSPAEIRLLEPWRKRIPKEVFEKAFQPPSTNQTRNIRKNLRHAHRLLKTAGYRIENNKLVSPRTRQAIQLEILLVSPAFERIVNPFAQNLRRLGINVAVRTVDQSQYINRIRNFDYDMIVGVMSQSESPGNEQRDYWSSLASDRRGSRNFIGLKNPVVDALVENIIGAPDRKKLIAAARALDRVLLWNHYVIPQWHSRVDRIAFWDKFGLPKHPKYGIDISSWWFMEKKFRLLKNKKNSVN